jgi:hypothetical protein
MLRDMNEPIYDKTPTLSLDTFKGTKKVPGGPTFFSSFESDFYIFDDLSKKIKHLIKNSYFQGSKNIFL